MTPTPSTTHQARIHLISEGVLASYIHDISARTARGTPSAMAPHGPALHRRFETPTARSSAGRLQA
jgi:hypothetical protein